MSGGERAVIDLQSAMDFIDHCEKQIYSTGTDLSDDERLRLFRLAGHTSDAPNYRAAWPPYTEMIADVRRRLANAQRSS